MKFELTATPPTVEDISREQEALAAAIRKIRRSDNILTAVMILVVTVAVAFAVYWTTRNLRYAAIAATVFPILGAALSAAGIITAAGFRSAAKQLVELNHAKIALNPVSEGNAKDIEELGERYDMVADYLEQVGALGRPLVNGELAMLWEWDASTQAKRRRSRNLAERRTTLESADRSTDREAEELDFDLPGVAPDDSPTLTWYFDFISPFAYLQFAQMDRLGRRANIDYRPVLLGALLDHWQTKGPAELPGKRLWTYRYVTWLGRQKGIPLKVPPTHPFKPLKPLRLAIALDCKKPVIGEIFHFIWGQGRSVDDPEEWRALCERLGVDYPDTLIGRQEVKDELRSNTDGAIAKGVFGVPTAMIGDELFWGYDATRMIIDYIEHPDMFSADDMARLAGLPASAERKQ